MHVNNKICLLPLILPTADRSLQAYSYGSYYDPELPRNKVALDLKTRNEYLRIL